MIGEQKTKSKFAWMIIDQVRGSAKQYFGSLSVKQPNGDQGLGQLWFHKNPRRQDSDFDPSARLFSAATKCNGKLHIPSATAFKHCLLAEGQGADKEGGKRIIPLINNLADQSNKVAKFADATNSECCQHCNKRFETSNARNIPLLCPLCIRLLASIAWGAAVIRTWEWAMLHIIRADNIVHIVLIATDLCTSLPILFYWSTLIHALHCNNCAKLLWKNGSIAIL